MSDSSIQITSSAFARIEDMREGKSAPALLLRISVEGGGCSGFQYKFTWDDQAPASDDVVFDDAVVIDSVSLPLLGGATLDYVVTLMGENFRINNPNAAAGCSCGASFTV